MAQIVLAEVGAAVGARLLPQGISVLGQQIAGQAIGRAVGTLAGGAIDRALLSEDIAGPRLKALHVMESREGAGIPSLYGRMRTGGQVIWAAAFTERRRETSAGGKGGPSVTEYRYSASFAVGLCEGAISRVDRVWANGEPLDLASVNARIYPGSETQEPDPLIEAIEGAGNVPAYRGLAYIVFEDLPLGAFGNRLPQLSFEIVRVPPGGDQLARHVDGVNIIPASGEFAYATDIISTRTFPGVETPQNANSGENRADFLRSLEQLRDELPRVSASALTIAWFGTDLRAGACEVRPGVETRDKVTRPWAWEGGGLGRHAAYLVSRDSDNRPAYGGTPADWSVIEAIQAQRAEGIEVTLSPFLLMDVPPGNGLPDPHGGAEQAPFPWRGRITSGHDGTAAARADIEAFLGSASVSDFSLDAQKVRYHGQADDWGYRRFVLHLAWLAQAAGGVDGFLLGSELRGLTRLRDAAGAFPFVEGLVALARDVRTILGPDTTLTYAADWTEYGAYLPGDGSNDVLFPLDALWADPAIDLVAVDWYPPAGDWRPGKDHLDAAAGYAGPGDAAYLRAQFAGGEGYDWYYASASDRAAQVRTPINDTAHGEHWVFRAKDLAGWWGAAHHERPGGVRASTPTAWVPGSKPIRLAEIGFPAVDLGPNAPNLFYDPKSSESALPPFSSGARDDVLQRRALSEALDYFAAQPFVERTFVWCWDARPFPAFPVRADVWGDGENWQFGHWLNGRTGLAPLADVVADLGRRGEVGALDTSGLDGIVEGYGLDGVTSLRAALEPLRAAHDFALLETATGLRAESRGRVPAPLMVARAETVDPGPGWTDTLLDTAPSRVSLAFADPSRDYQAGSVEARLEGRDPRNLLALSLPLALSAPEAERIASQMLDAAQPRRLGALGLAFTRQDVTVGSVLDLDTADGTWRVTALSDGPDRQFTLEPVSGTARVPNRALTPPAANPSIAFAAAPELMVIDAPRLPGEPADARPLVAATARPWPVEVTVEAGPAPEAMTERARITAPALMGRLVTNLAPGPLGRWDRAATFEVEMSETALTSLHDEAVLAGGNLLLVETTSGWELLSFSTAELVSGARYRLTGLLRGLQGSAPVGTLAGARCLLLDRAVIRGVLARDEQGLPLSWQAGGTGDARLITFGNVQALPWSVAHPRAASGLLTWVRRHPDNSDSWVLPDENSPERYRLRWTLAGGLASETVVTQPSASIPSGAVSVAIAEIGSDDRAGPETLLQL